MNKLERTLKAHLALGPNQRKILSLSQKSSYTFEEQQFLDQRYRLPIEKYCDGKRLGSFNGEAYTKDMRERIESERNSLMQILRGYNLSKELPKRIAGELLAASINLIGALGGGIHVVRVEED